MKSCLVSQKNWQDELKKQYFLVQHTNYRLEQSIWDHFQFEKQVWLLDNEGTIFPLLLAISKYFLFDLSDLFYVFDLDFLKHQFSTCYLQTASNCSVQDGLIVISIHSVSEKLSNRIN